MSNDWIFVMRNLGQLKIFELPSLFSRNRPTGPIRSSSRNVHMYVRMSVIKKNKNNDEASDQNMVLVILLQIGF